MTPSSEPIGTKLIRVLVADDHALFREGLCSLLREARFEVVAEATTGLEALEATQTHSPDIVLMDVAMPGLSGLEAARRIRKACPATRVIALSVHGNEEYVIRALENGCAGYLSKGVRAGEIFAGIERVAAGGRAFDADALEAVIRAVLRLRSAADGTGGAKHQLITDREREILQLIAEGKSAKAIAAELGVSFKTVEIHRGNIMRKLDLHNSGELIKYAASRGFVVL